MMDTETSNDDEVSVTEMLELQLSEIEMLQSMFPDTREFKLDDQAAVINIKGFLSGQIKYDYLYDRIGFTVHLELENSKVCESTVNFSGSNTFWTMKICSRQG